MRRNPEGGIGVQFRAFLKFADMGDVFGIVEHQTIGFRFVALQQRSKNHPGRAVLVKIGVVVQLVFRIETGKFALVLIADQVAADLRVIRGGVSVENRRAFRGIGLQSVQENRDSPELAAEKIRRVPRAAEVIRRDIQLRFARIGAEETDAVDCGIDVARNPEPVAVVAGEDDRIGVFKFFAEFCRMRAGGCLDGPVIFQFQPFQNLVREAFGIEVVNRDVNHDFFRCGPVFDHVSVDVEKPDQRFPRGGFDARIAAQHPEESSPGTAALFRKRFQGRSFHECLLSFLLIILENRKKTRGGKR